MLSPGDKVKDCEVIAPLGSGGMATLYLARRRGVGGFSRLVTLKLVHQHLIEDENIIKRFLDEARICAHVAHPNVVHVEEIGQYRGGYFIAMEYVHGVSLAELLARLTERRLRLRPKLCVWLAAQVAEALHAAHEATGEDGVPLDIVHRDVSPQNVLIGHTGHVKLIDFGIAKSQTEADPRSGGHPVLGKLRYMAPEQLRLERADRRTDVYALGVMLWEMLAGRSLLRCRRFDDERDWATRENPPAPSKYSVHTTPSLDRVVLKAIACEPSERYDSAFQFRAALLRADPAAVKLDAPMVAALMRSQLGDELDRRRASWPSEVAGELEVAPEVTTSQNWSVDELTAENLGSCAHSHDHDESVNRRFEAEPTLAMHHGEHDFGALGDGIWALAAVRSDLMHALAATSVSYDTLVGLRLQNAAADPSSQVMAQRREHTLHRMIVPAPESAIDTLKLPPAQAGPLELLARTRSLRGAAIGAVGLVFGIFFGAFLSPTPAPETEPTSGTSATYAQRDCGLGVPLDTKILTASAVDASASEVAEFDVQAAAARSARATRKEWRAYSNRRNAVRVAKQVSKGSANRRPPNRLVHSL